MASSSGTTSSTHSEVVVGAAKSFSESRTGMTLKPNRVPTPATNMPK